MLLNINGHLLVTLHIHAATVIDYSRSIATITYSTK